jgi:hypothetical protein
MINYSDITKAIESILKAGTDGYVISRNALRNADPSIAAKGKGWIGIYRGPVEIQPNALGGRIWIYTVKPQIEIQVASMKSGAEAEDRLQAAEKEILNVLNLNDITRRLNGTVGMSMGYSITYEYNSESQVWFHSAIITITAEVRA